MSWVPDAPPPEPGTGVEAIDDRAHLAVFGLCFYMLTSVALVVLGLMQVAKLDDAIELQSRPFDSIEEIDIGDQAALFKERDDLAELGTILWLVAFLFAGVTFIRWFHRAYRNLDELAPGERRFQEGWAVLGWGIPLLNLVRPKQIADDIARGVGMERRALLGWWWGLWILTQLFSGGASAFTGSDDPEGVRSLDIFFTVTSGLSLIPAVVAIVVVRRITVAHAIKARTGLADDQALDFKLT